jgi:ribosomal protein S18 acetylase RimI-like enzyme
LTDQPGLQFLIVGDGVEKERLQKRSQGLPNVRYLPMQSKAVYPQVVAAADVALVTLRPEVATPTVPSKIATIMSAGRPIVASIPLCGDLPKIIAQAESGVVAPAADGRALAEAILALKRDPERARRLGINGRHFAETQLSRQVCVGQIEDLFQRLISEKRKTHSASSFSGNTDALIIRPARYEDLDDVVRIHLAAFGSRFNLPALGPRFLKRYYELVLNFESKVFMVAECDGKVAGFVAGFINSGGFYAHMRRNKWRLAIAAARAIPADPSVIPRLIHIAERMKGALKRPDALNVQSSKLASIAVDPALGRKGLGKKLVYAFLEEARRQGADDVYLTTDAKKNHAVNEFYRGLGFTLSSSFRAPKQRVLNEYCKSLLDSTNSVAPVQK